MKRPVSLLIFITLLAALGFNSALCQPLTPSLTLVYTRANGRVGDIALTGSGEVLFTNYPTKPGRLWLLSGGTERLVYEAPKASYDLYGVAASRDGDVYVSCPYTGEVLRIARGGGIFTVYVRAGKNVGPLAFAPNGTLYMAELIPTEGYQSVFRLVPTGAVTASGSMAAVLVFTSPITIGGIAFNSRGELFFSDGPRGRLWKLVNATPVLYVDRKGWSTMYGIVFDQYDNLYFCDWSSPGNIYYLDFRLSLAYRVLDGNNAPLAGASVLVTMPNGSSNMFYSNSTGYVSLARAWPGAYVLNVSWGGVPVGSFRFEESASGSRNLACRVFNAKLAAKDDAGRVLKDCTLEVALPNGTLVRLSSPASLSRVPAGLVTVRAFYRGVEVADRLQVNVSSNVDVSISCRVYSLSLRLLDPDGNPFKDAWIMVSLDGATLVNQSYPESGVALDGLLGGRCLIAASFKGFVVAQSSFDLNSSRSIVLTANVSGLVVKARDLLGLPMQGVRVDLTLPDGSSVSGFTDANGSFALRWLPAGDVSVVLDSGFEKRTLSLSLDKSLVEASQVFSLSLATVSVTIVVLLLVLIILPPSRRLIAKAFPIEVSVEGRRGVAEAYVDFLSSRGLSVEEALEFKNGVASILVGEGNVLPRFENAVDHAVLLVSDPSVIPPRREIHVLVEASGPEDVKAASELVKEYSGSMGLRVVGIIVCKEVTDGLLSLLKELRDVEVVFTTRRILGV
jgi:hypothetical protein